MRRSVQEKSVAWPVDLTQLDCKVVDGRQERPAAANMDRPHIMYSKAG
jgi:hypothetical protein